MAKLFSGYDGGTANAFAYKHDYLAHINMRQREEMLTRQAKLDAQARAQLLTDDLQIPESFNEWDDPIIKANAEKQFREIGKLVSQNPDWHTDPSALAKLKVLKNNVINNEDVFRAKKFADEVTAMQEWAKDPRNRPFLNGDHVKSAQMAIENYRKFGSIDGAKGGGKEFTWIPPHTGVNTTAEFGKMVSELNHDQTQQYGYGGLKQSVSNQRVREMIQRTLADDQSELGASARYEYEERTGKPFDFNDATEWYYEKTVGFKKRDLIQDDPSFANKIRMAKASGSQQESERDVWAENTRRLNAMYASSQGSTSLPDAKFNQRSMDILMLNEKNETEINNSRIKKEVKMPNGEISHEWVDIPVTGMRPASYTGNVTIIGNGADGAPIYGAEAWVSYDKEEFAQIQNQSGIPFLQEDFWDSLIEGNIAEFNDLDSWWSGVQRTEGYEDIIDFEEADGEISKVKIRQYIQVPGDISPKMNKVVGYNIGKADPDQSSGYIRLSNGTIVSE